MVGVVWTFGQHARDAWLRYSTVLEPNTPLEDAGHLIHPCNLYNPRLGAHREAEISENFAEYQRCLRWACWDDNIQVTEERLRAESQASTTEFNRRRGELAAAAAARRLAARRAGGLLCDAAGGRPPPPACPARRAELTPPTHPVLAQVRRAGGPATPPGVSSLATVRNKLGGVSHHSLRAELAACCAMQLGARR
jgi:hypothetical protein